MVVNTEVVFESEDIQIQRQIKEGVWQNFFIVFKLFLHRGKIRIGHNGERMAVNEEIERIKKFSPELLLQIEFFLIKNYPNSEGQSITEAENVRELNIKEANTVFSKNISTILKKVSLFAEIKRLSNKKYFLLKLTEEESSKLYNELNRGVLIIQTQRHLYAYMRAYSSMHQAKLNESFDVITDLPTELNGKNIQIIDYGCGQGFGSIVFMDFLRSNYLTNTVIQTVTLIEPSIEALRTASEHVNFCLKIMSKNANIVELYKKIEQIDLQDLATNPTSIKIHILSNILDVDDFSIANFAQKIDKSQEGVNYFICVSPNLGEERNSRLDAFINYFQQQRNVTVLSLRETNIRDWTRYERVFKVTD